MVVIISLKEKYQSTGVGQRNKNIHLCRLRSRMFSGEDGGMLCFPVFRGISQQIAADSWVSGDRPAVMLLVPAQVIASKLWNHILIVHCIRIHNSERK